MYRKDLQNLLTKSDFPHFFLLYGADNFQIELYANCIKKKWDVDEVFQVFFEDYDYARANDFLALSSLFSEKKLLEIKCSKKLSTKELKNLIMLCSSRENFLLVELYDEGSKQNELEKIFGNNFARFFKPSNMKEGIELLTMKAKELQITLTQNALFLLLKNFDENLYLAAAELNKFQGQSVDEAMIEKYCYSLNGANFESFFEKLLQKIDCKDEIERLLENTNEIALINLLYSNFYRLFKIALYAKIYGSVDFKELLGYIPPVQVRQTLSQQAFNIRVEQYKEIFSLLLQSEYELKTQSKLIKKEFLLSSLLKLSRILKA
ncbi:hypothetical protein OQH60_00520 [Campylobacter sp. MIT 21-1685]|uniref:hypothetical protein n=1 Tax=unclassified Campylobacter TaxID=2593542 RepID=UPI00224B07C3|nr:MULTISPECIES: hypothetical protein [unclassified Campylobacter]MCX2682331.1 hypothetical protein [Campylobacter sp. MIT 21-1684]MCX2750611.1 hypothetical protein [Campylobacter sp. MIT 21-1682]MCX2806842.1 hypothetical protein [Campylobacter sp. MIT 21-1685]